MNIVKQYITGDIEWRDIAKLGDVLEVYQWFGVALPADLAYLSYEYNVTTSYLNFWQTYQYYGSDFLTKLGTTGIF